MKVTKQATLPNGNITVIQGVVLLPLYASSKWTLRSHFNLSHPWIWEEASCPTDQKDLSKKSSWSSYNAFIKWSYRKMLVLKRYNAGFKAEDWSGLSSCLEEQEQINTDSEQKPGHKPKPHFRSLRWHRRAVKSLSWSPKDPGLNPAFPAD